MDMPLGLLTITRHDCAVRIRPGSLCFHYIMYSKSADELQLPAQEKQTFSHLHSKYMYIHIYIYLNSLFFILLIKPFLRWNRRYGQIRQEFIHTPEGKQIQEINGCISKWAVLKCRCTVAKLWFTVKSSELYNVSWMFVL